jgi:hypothetical protein
MAPIIKSVPAAELVNPSQQNNVFQFVQTTKPTERSAGVALVAGDRWYKTDDQTEWSWNGTYWLSPPVNLSTHGIYTVTTTTVIGNSVPSFPIGSSISNGTFNNFLYVHWRGITYSAASPLWNSNNRWSIAFRELTIDQTQLLVLDAQIPVPPNLDSYFLKGYSGSVTITNDIQNFSFGVYFSAGTPSAIRLNHIVVFSYIYP